jgi:CheY-like chemotaxis protein
MSQQTSHPGEILIVDDTPINLRLLAALLQREGYRVRCESSGATALQSVQLFPPALILLDITMPEMDGYEVCRRLKAEPVTADIPVIFVSALDPSLEEKKVAAAGGLDYIAKPYRIHDVLSRVQKGLKRNVAVDTVVDSCA